MAPATAEKLHTYPTLELVEQAPELPLIINIAEMMEDQLVRMRAERLIRSVGDTAISTEIEAVPEPAEKITSLMDAIHLAAKGNETARKMVETNVRTDVIERTIKSGHIMNPIELEIAEDGSIWQYGQSLEAVQSNNLLHANDTPEMTPRSHAEARNAYRLENISRLGLLEDYWFVVHSRAADNMSGKTMEETGFFTETMTTVIQATTIKEGALVVEPAFVAGKKAPNQPRHDAETLARVGEQLGVDYKNKSAAEIIDTPLLVHKDLMPNGVADLVWLYDKSAGDTFFGEEKQPQDYLAYRQQCYKKEETFETKVKEIVNELLAESLQIKTPVQATQRLHKISEKHMVRKAVEDRSINSAVFGVEAARHIEQARWLQAQGDIAGMGHHIAKAESKAQSSSCPTGAKSGTNSIGENSQDSPATDGPGNSEGLCTEVKDGQETNCPYCKRRVKAIVKGREKIYCSNKNCEAAAPEVKAKDKK